MVPDRLMAEPWDWAGHSGQPLQVRDGLYQALERELDAIATASGPASEAARAWSAAQSALGWLAGLVAGLDDALIDRVPAEDEWPLRATFAHILLTERRYALQVRYALNRSGDQPTYQEGPRELEAGEADGGVADWIARLAAERDANRDLAEIATDSLRRPTRWAGYDVDIRFRLHRFASHIAEHTVQAEKTLQMLQIRGGEAALIAPRIGAARGAHELHSESARIEDCDAALADLAGHLVGLAGSG